MAPGATSLINEENIQNPYFGDKMMTCGIVKTTIDKKYDAVASVRAERLKYAEAIEGMSAAEIIAYTKRMAQESGVQLGDKV